ncbi:sporulation membrane protein YtaF [Salipaludibacillus neizhouensis]|uniref:Sporulation membrane protein YtaF n=1 Tax=Salipaludibacillus neizhouensis TaxID=885475 RepID=A0A3A9K0R4_9BACI|nr:sporulation membrane protein YtaF [Salipaludibacillus neizhouensis]RKL66694.1 sporulation membrane protein YtaF [Salipaludibacillus neizhouensis]
MVEWLPILILAFAVSLDSFGVGVTYGLRKMKLPFISILSIMGCSAASVLLAMWVGVSVGGYLSVAAAERLGGFLLIGIGMFAMFQVFRHHSVTKKKGISEEKMVVNVELKQLGIVIRILRKPMEADLDDSGSITGAEAVLLGIALSLDAFGAGLGAALLGVSPLILAVSVAFMCGLFLTLGKLSGEKLMASSNINGLTFLPGLLLIILGLWKI